MKNYKSEFPIFAREIHGKPLVFLDSAASAQKPVSVISAMTDFMQMHYANVNRGVYLLSEEATGMMEATRRKVAEFIGANAEEIVFTRNATESINLVAYSWARKNLTQGDIVVLSEMEHHANIVPWQQLRDEIGIELEWIPVSDEGYLEWEKLKEKIALPARTDKVRLVCLAHVSNVLGTINDVQAIGKWAHSIGAKFLVDGAQGVTNLPVDVKAIDCDWYVFSGHKLYGPTGVGVLYGKKEVLAGMDPFLTGGDMILEVHKERTTFQETPHKFEAGTPAITEIVGLGAAVDFVKGIGMPAIREHTVELLEYAINKLKSIDGLRIFGPEKSMDRGGVISFSLGTIHPHDIASILDEQGIAIRSGHHCAQPICDRYQVPALARVSFGIYNAKEDIDRLYEGLLLVQKTFA